jgi:hypothetical protein
LAASTMPSLVAARPGRCSGTEGGYEALVLATQHQYVGVGLVQVVVGGGRL